MKKGIMIFGPAGSGKTTLGSLVAQQLHFTFVDIDDYIWRKDTEIPFTRMYSRSEKISNLMGAISETNHFVMAGSMDSFHEYFDPFFVLAVHLTAPVEVRVARVQQREYQRFGNRILEGGDMYDEHLRFLADVAAYETGGSTSLTVHNAWAESLHCPVLRLDGREELTTNMDTIIMRYATACAIK
ncbi:MAG: AAA family ATPase [Clostridiales bacterium]|nr:AAA family ATPase [Clostridiales bacterium]